ncbi:hypothetical protein DFH27DRAFT_624228 [Peziza echinospora]|nr:hypothetical protein DFH27DRAFT_624228 [Peziza echinospora]
MPCLQYQFGGLCLCNGPISNIYICICHHIKLIMLFDVIAFVIFCAFDCLFSKSGVIHDCRIRDGSKLNSWHIHPPLNSADELYPSRYYARLGTYTIQYVICATIWHETTTIILEYRLKLSKSPLQKGQSTVRARPKSTHLWQSVSLELRIDKGCNSPDTAVLE